MEVYTEKQRAALIQAMASGALTVEDPQNGRVTYRTFDEMQRALAMVEAGLAAQAAGAGARRRVRQVVVVSRSGW